MASVRLSLAINAISQVSALFLTIGSMAIISRLLTPAEFGLFSVSASVIAFGHVFRDFGIGQYLVQVKVASRDNLRAAFTVMLSISWIIALVLYAVRVPISHFYGYESVGDVVAVLALSFVILPFGAPHLSMLRREMRFGWIAAVNLGNLLVQTATTIGLALHGESYMSMAWGAVAGNLATVVLLMLARPKEALLLPKFSGTGEVVKFGTKSSTISLAGVFGSSAPDLIMGRTLGFADVAIFSRAGGLANMVLNQLVNVVRGVYFPAFAERVRNGGNPAAIYAHASGQLLGFIVPLLSLMALLSEPLIAFLFGEQWGRAAPLAAILCCYAMLGAVFSLADVSLVACGKIDVLVRGTLMIQAARILAIMSSLVLGLEGVVMLLGVAAIVKYFVYMRAMNIALGVTASSLWGELWRSYALVPATLLGPALLLLANRFFPLHLSDFVILVVASLLALGGWFLAICVIRHPLLPELQRVIRRGRVAA